MKNAVWSSPVCFAVLTEALACCADYTVDWPWNTGYQYVYHLVCNGGRPCEDRSGGLGARGQRGEQN